MGSFFTELKRRNVFKVGVAYIIVAWIVMQAADVITQNLGLPAWFPQIVTALLILGLPIAIVFAWAFELTPEGVKPTAAVGPDESITHSTGRKLDFAIIGLLSLAVIYLVIDNYVLVEETSPSIISTTVETKTDETITSLVVTDRKSVAVLPFANRSTSEDDGFFVDGLHDDLLTHLSKITDMKVISRTSVMGYRDTQKNMKVIGVELGVATIMEGGVQRSGNRVRINVQL
jgi:TolB-like protein